MVWFDLSLENRTFTLSPKRVARKYYENRYVDTGDPPPFLIFVPSVPTQEQPRPLCDNSPLGSLVAFYPDASLQKS